MNLIRQLEKIHDLGYARPGNPLSGGYFRLSHPGIVIQFSPPRLRQHKRMDARFRYFGFVLIGRGEAFKNVGRERDWMENKRLVTPTGKGYSNGQTELPESSGFARASGAIRSGFRPRRKPDRMAPSLSRDQKCLSTFTSSASATISFTWDPPRISPAASPNTNPGQAAKPPPSPVPSNSSIPNPILTTPPPFAASCSSSAGPAPKNLPSFRAIWRI